MWYHKVTRDWVDDKGVTHTNEYVEAEESWYDILFQSFLMLLLALWAIIVCVFFTPFMALRAAWQSHKLADGSVPTTEVRERAHLA